MIRKIFKTGHSLAVTVSQKSLKELGWKEGDSVDVQADSAAGKITIKLNPRDAQLLLNLSTRPRLGSKANR